MDDTKKLREQIETLESIVAALLRYAPAEALMAMQSTTRLSLSPSLKAAVKEGLEREAANFG